MQFRTINQRQIVSDRIVLSTGSRGRFFAFSGELNPDPAAEGVVVRFGSEAEQYGSREYWPDIGFGVRLGCELVQRQGVRVCSAHLVITYTKEHPVDTSSDVVRILFAGFIQSRVVELSEPVPPLHPDWLTSDVVALARGIHANSALDGLPALTDALLEAGCDHPLALEHLRTCPDHGTSCWVVEMICAQAAGG